MKRAFIITDGKSVVHERCSYRTGMCKLTGSLSAARMWATAETAQRYLDTAYKRPEVSERDLKVVELVLKGGE